MEINLPYCNICMGASDSLYMQYNHIISGVILPIVGFIGLIGNFLVMIVYGSREERKHSTNIYLAALAASDFCMICTALVLYAFEAWRHHADLIIATLYGRGTPYVFPISTILQTTSVYFCVMAAVDCFVRVVLTQKAKEMFCTTRCAKMVTTCITVISFAYNLPHFFELASVDCIDDTRNRSLSVQVCPTVLRTNELYYKLYYTYMYTIFMAAGPLLIMVFLNFLVVVSVLRKGPSDDTDTISLILVVFMFIFCNTAALLVNFLEMFFANKINALVYLVDMSNLLVVLNCTANFFCYFFFGNSFRRTLRLIISTRCSKESILHGNSEKFVMGEFSMNKGDQEKFGTN